MAANIITPAHIRASRRHAGHHAAHRHVGVHHAHRAPGGHSHGHGHAHTGVHAPRHHHTTARSTHGLTERGVVSAYNAGSNTATVQLVGTLTRLIGPLPVSLAVPTAGLAGKNCLVVLLDAHNPSDAVLVASW